MSNLAETGRRGRHPMDRTPEDDSAYDDIIHQIANKALSEDINGAIGDNKMVKNETNRANNSGAMDVVSPVQKPVAKPVQPKAEVRPAAKPSTKEKKFNWKRNLKLAAAGVGAVAVLGTGAFGMNVMNENANMSQDYNQQLRNKLPNSLVKGTSVEVKDVEVHTSGVTNDKNFLFGLGKTMLRSSKADYSYVVKYGDDKSLEVNCHGADLKIEDGKVKNVSVANCEVPHGNVALSDKLAVPQTQAPTPTVSK